MQRIALIAIKTYGGNANTDTNGMQVLTVELEEVVVYIVPENL